MKKPITETRVFCDFCEEPAWAQCIICDKDLCKDHRVVLNIYLDRGDRHFSACLCPDCAQPLVPFLDYLKGKSTTWQKAGHNPEFNEARLVEILDFLQPKADVSTIS